MMVKITIKMNEHRMDALEEIFFKEQNKKSYEKIKPTILNIWREICKKYGKKTSKQ